MATRGITPRRCDCGSATRCRGSRRGTRSSTRASTPSATRRRIAERSATGSAAHAGNAAAPPRPLGRPPRAPPACTRRARSRRSARCRRRCAVEATRSPPIQCRRSTRTPSISAMTAWSAMPLLVVAVGTPDFVRGQTYWLDFGGSRTSHSAQRCLARRPHSPIVRTQTASGVNRHTPNSGGREFASTTSLGDLHEPRRVVRLNRSDRPPGRAQAPPRPPRRPRDRLLRHLRGCPAHRHGRWGTGRDAARQRSRRARDVPRGHRADAGVRRGLRRDGEAPHLGRRLLLLRVPGHGRVRRRRRGVGGAAGLQRDADRPVRTVGLRLLSLPVRRLRLERRPGG